MTHGPINPDRDGLAGRIKGSFDHNRSVILDMQIIKRF
jgi:hypothetical protein